MTFFVKSSLLSLYIFISQGNIYVYSYKNYQQHQAKYL